MGDEGMTPSQFQVLREDIAQMRTEWNQRFDNLVTRDTFSDERRRVDGRFLDQAREVADLKTALEKESTARVAAQTDALNAQIRERNEREKVKRQTTWQWLALVITLVAGPTITILVTAALAQAGIIGGG